MDWVVKVWDTLPRWLQVVVVLTSLVMYVITKIRAAGTRLEQEKDFEATKLLVDKINEYHTILDKSKGLLDLAKGKLTSEGEKVLLDLLQSGVKKLVAKSTEPNPELKAKIDRAINEVEGITEEKKSGAIAIATGAFKKIF
jgi:hypothetical protein